MQKYPPKPESSASVVPPCRGSKSQLDACNQPSDLASNSRETCSRLPLEVASKRKNVHAVWDAHLHHDSQLQVSIAHNPVVHMLGSRRICKRGQCFHRLLRFLNLPNVLGEISFVVISPNSTRWSADPKPWLLRGNRLWDTLLA